MKSALIDTGPGPFTWECLSPWERVLGDPDVSSHTDMISDVLVSVRVAAVSDKLTRCHWLERTMETRPGTSTSAVQEASRARSPVTAEGILGGDKHPSRQVE